MIRSSKSSLLKIGLITLYLILFLYLFCIRFFGDIEIEALYLGVLIGYILIRRGVQSLWREIKLFLPLLITMTLVYVLFALLKVEQFFEPDSVVSSWNYWLRYGGIRMILLLSTMLTVREGLSFISIHDILALPLPITLKKSIILGNILFSKSSQVVDISEFTLKQFPLERRGGRGFRRIFRRNITLILGLVLFLRRESTIQGELIDNRVKHCFGREKIGE